MESKNVLGNPVVTLAAAVIILAGLISAKVIIIPILLAVFIAILASPFLLWLQSKGLSGSISLATVLLVLVIAMTLLGLLISSSLNDFMINLPSYEEKFRTVLSSSLDFLRTKGLEFSDESIKGLIDPAEIAKFVSGVIKGLGSVLTNGFMILLLVIFMLLEISVLPQKLHVIHTDASSHAKEFLHNVKQYMLIKSIFSFFTALLVYISLLFIGLDYALLWGVLAFLLNFIPNIGSIIAAIPAIVLALVQLGFTAAVEVALVFVAVNVVFGSVLEPKYMGKGLGLSTLVVFISLIFWGWVFGPVGMLLSIPLTIMLKLGLQVNPQTKWIAVLLGTENE